MLQLMTMTKGHDELKLYNGAGKRVFTFKNSKTVFHTDFNTPLFLQRWSFVAGNGTLIINPAERSDSGTYTVEIFNEATGASVGKHTIQIIVGGLEYGRVSGGQRVSVQLVLNAAGYELKFYSTTYGQEGVFTFKNNMTAFHKRFNTPLFLQRWTFVAGNGTLIINPAESSDSGTYTVEIYRESTGRIAGKQTIVLNIAGTVQMMA
ncbi:uncharacterized protein LOC134442939 [Engraulis encrasicolus]|uniref:uncharacterized protein LOC134442939 n=1 Tax=Engraulis encrasicolus TaxID=184585 RepID=UPI002FD0A7C4